MAFQRSGYGGRPLSALPAGTSPSTLAEMATNPDDLARTELNSTSANVCLLGWTGSE
jgi:hypothetical protein